MESTLADLKISYVCIGKQISHKEENTEDIFFVFMTPHYIHLSFLNGTVGQKAPPFID
jgi:hypothetical protein